jgi:hypothetical protein
MPPEQPRVLLMGAPVLTGLAQVRDPQTGTDYFVPCNPCAAPTPKTPMLGSTDAAPEATGKPAARPQPSVLAKLDAHTVATLAMPAEADAIPAGSAQLTDDVRPVTVSCVGPSAATPVRKRPVPCARSRFPAPWRSERRCQARLVRAAAAGHEGRACLYPWPH